MRTGSNGVRAVIRPWQFLALVFRHLRGKSIDRVSFEDLNGYSQCLKSRYGIEVSWDKDGYNYCFGFYGPVFSLYGSDRCPEADGVLCMFPMLMRHYGAIVGNGPKIPGESRIKLEIKEE